MARVVKVFRTLRNHWKKSTFAFCVLSYGGHWLYGKHCDSVLRREACLAAREFGRQLILPQEPLKKATVILNPAACNGKANKLFEKNAAPILHLAGIQVTLVKKIVCDPVVPVGRLFQGLNRVPLNGQESKTDYEGQAKKLLELLEHTDMLIVAGGDGTLQEVITGLLRRNDQDSFSEIPIGFIPLGSQNSLNESLYLPSDNPVTSISSAALSILRGETMPLDVLQIKGEMEQPVFALLGVRWGAFRDVAASISKYWYLGPLKIKAAHWFSTLREWPQDRQVSLSYLGPTPRPPDEPTEKPPRPPLLRRIIHRLRLYWSPPMEEPPLEEPEVWVQEEASTAELSITTRNRNPALKCPEDSMLVCLEPNSLTTGQFVTIGTEKTGDPHLCSAWGQHMQASVCRIGLPKEGAGFYNIDNEEYEAMAVEVRLLPRKLHFFCSAERKEQLLSEPH